MCVFLPKPWLDSQKSRNCRVLSREDDDFPGISLANPLEKNAVQKLLRQGL
jgi:hypothetical protein